MKSTWEQLQNAIVGTSAHIARREYDWVFSFGEVGHFCVASSWRLRNENCILLTDYEDGHQYGLPAPIDAESKANQILESAVVRSLTFHQATADIAISFSNDVLLEFITNSSGYESWQAYLGSELAFVGRNG